MKIIIYYIIFYILYYINTQPISIEMGWDFTVCPDGKCMTYDDACDKHNLSENKDRIIIDINIFTPQI